MAKMTKLERARRSRIKAGKAKASDIYTYQHWSKMYRSVKNYAKKKGIDNPYRSRKEFIDYYLNARQANERSAAEEVRKKVRQSVPDRHSPQFFSMKYQEIKRYAEKNGLPFKFKSVRAFISEYRARKEGGSKRPLDEIKYFMKHKTSYKVSKAEYAMSKMAVEEWRKRKEQHEIRLAEFKMRQEEKRDVEERLEAGEVFDQEYLDEILDVSDPGKFDEPEPPAPLSLKQFQDMTTKEVAEMYKEQIKATYHAARERGMSSYDAKAEVSMVYFGGDS